MRIFVVSDDWANDSTGSFGGGVLKAFVNPKDAVGFLKSEVKEYLSSHGPADTVYEDTDACFDCGEDGYYASDHYAIRITELELE